MEQRAFPYVPVKKDDIDLDAITDDWMLEEKIRKPFESIKIMKNYFTREYPEMKYNRCLGWGGNGLAAAYDVINEEGEKEKSIVVKMLFSDDQELQKWEVQNSQCVPSIFFSSWPLREVGRHRKAEHIIQLLYAEGLGLVDNDNTRSPDGSSKKTPDSPASSDVDMERDDNTRNPDGSLKECSGSPGSPADENLDRNGDRDEDLPNTKRTKTGAPPVNIFITEMLDNGDLSSIIKKVRQHGDRIPNPILWSFLLCFVRMCIGLAYPPADIEEFKGNPGPIKETIPARLRDHPRRIVHFDMDPRNIFVGDVRQGSEDEHGMAPILKLGDFGLATEVVPGKHDFYYERLRQFGKRGYFAPEQFCQDWDYIEPDKDLVQHQLLAGNFGVHTNVWAVGYLMENLITLSYPAGPPIPTVSTVRPPDGKNAYLTYARHLQQPFYAAVDEDLIALILRMQAHLPEDRPSLHEIETYVLFHIQNKGNDGMSDYELDEWMRRILYEVPPRSNEQYVPMPVIREIIGTGQMDPVPNFNFAPAGTAPRSPNKVPEKWEVDRQGDDKEGSYMRWVSRVIRSRAGLRKIYDELPKYPPRTASPQLTSIAPHDYVLVIGPNVYLFTLISPMYD
ncbi:kinase-like domain-containing protein [Xylaria longipes]|nr:kinase-like domain-containing protein [Xylaria longipes]